MAIVISIQMEQKIGKLYIMMIKIYLYYSYSEMFNN